MKPQRIRLFCFLLPSLVSLLALYSPPSAAQDSPHRLFPQVQLGKASFYCPSFHGNRTAPGIRYNEKEPVAAHPYYPFGTVVRDTNLANDRFVELTVVDRGPSRKHQKRGAVIDVSRSAARDRGLLRQGRARVRVEVLEWFRHPGKFEKP